MNGAERRDTMARTLSSPIALRTATLDIISADIMPRASNGSDAQKADLARRIEWLENQPESFWLAAIRNHGGSPGTSQVFLLDVTSAMNFLRAAPKA